MQLNILFVELLNYELFIINRKLIARIHQQKNQSKGRQRDTDCRVIARVLGNASGVQQSFRNDCFNWFASPGTVTVVQRSNVTISPFTPSPSGTSPSYGNYGQQPTAICIPLPNCRNTTMYVDVCIRMAHTSRATGHLLVCMGYMYIWGWVSCMCGELRQVFLIEYQIEFLFFFFSENVDRAFIVGQVDIQARSHGTS